MSKYIPKEQLEPLMCKPGEEVIQPTLAPQPHTRSSIIGGDYALMSISNTYAKAMEDLNEVCRTDSRSDQPTTVDGIIRPLTFKETLQARVNDYESIEGDDRLRLFKRWSHSCTGVAYKAGTQLMKVIPQSLDLINIDPSFNSIFLPTTYDDLVGEELDLAKGKYCATLSKADVLEHPAWLATVEGDRNLLSNYTNIVFHELKEQYSREDGMWLWVRSQPDVDELRALFVDYLNNGSIAIGNDNLNGYASFLRVVAQESERAGGAR
jgi:hypothetical protein